MSKSNHFFGQPLYGQLINDPTNDPINDPINLQRGKYDLIYTFVVNE